MRGIAERLHNTKKVISHRLAIVRGWRSESEKRHPLEDCPHRLHKFNLNCGCKMCHYYKHCGNSKAKYKHSDLKKMQDE